MISKIINGLIYSESGTTIPEYAILVAVIGLVVIIAAALFGENLARLFESFTL